MMKKRAVSAPYFSISACGSTPLFFDFDIVPTPAKLTSAPSAARLAETILPFASRLTSTSEGLTHSRRPCGVSR